MSHFTQVKVEFKNKEFLISTLKRLFPGQVFSNGQVRGFHDNVQNAEIVLRGKDSDFFDIGFSFSKDSCEMKADWWGASRIFGTLEEFTKKLKVEYSRTNVQFQAKKQGYFYSEKSDEKTGQIRITLTKFTG